LENEQEISREEIVAQLARIIASPLFQRSERLRRFLNFSVDAALRGDEHRVKEYVVGTEVFDRGPAFDPRVDPVVRVEARRLRTRLREWHENDGRDCSFVIELPTGSYAAQFRHRNRVEISGQSSSQKTIAVLPFANLNADPELDYFSDGLTEELIHALTRLEGLQVVAWPSVSRLKGQESAPAELAAKLNVENILRGTVRRSGDRLRMTAQLINAADGHFLWSEAWDRAASDLLSIEQEIAGAIAAKLRVGGPQAERSASVRKALHPEAHTLYLKGRFHWNKRDPEGLRLAVEYFRLATEREPSWALAWAGLADSYAVLATYNVGAPGPSIVAAREAAQHALALDPNLAEAITCLAFASSAYDWNWHEGEQLYQRAISLSPSYVTAHHWYGSDFLALFGRMDEAIEHLDEAVRLDPLSSIVLDTRAFLSMIAGRYEDAEHRLQEILQLDPFFAKSWSGLGRLYTEMGEYRKAIEMLERARSLAGDFPKTLGALGQALGLAGKTEQAREVLALLERKSQTQYVGHTTIALVHLGLGEREAALDHVERAVEERELSTMWLKAHPVWATLRPESRLQRLLVRMGLA
jgi:serine/threonine-protein kinase